MPPGTPNTGSVDVSEDSADEPTSSSGTEPHSETDDAGVVESSDGTGEEGDGTGEEGELCPVVESVEQIGSHWRLAVLHELQDGERRFNELKRRTDANARTLSRVLSDLQEDGLVRRRVEEDAPVATFYGLSRKGEALCPVFDELEAWGQEWVVGDTPGDE